MKVIKRNGAEVEFDIVKIIAAVTKANAATEEDARMTPVQIQRIAESVELLSCITDTLNKSSFHKCVNIFIFISDFKLSRFYVRKNTF